MYSINALGSNTFKLSGTWTCCEVYSKFYYIQAKVYNYLDTEEMAIDEVKYWIRVTNPCLREDSITQQNIDDLDYWIKDSAVSISFTDFEDWASTEYYYSGSDLCGPKEYAVYQSDKFTPFDDDQYPTVNSSYLVSGSTHTLSFQTDDVSLYTNDWETLYIRIILIDYYAIYPQFGIRFEPFRYRLKNC